MWAPGHVMSLFPCLVSRGLVCGARFRIHFFRFSSARPTMRNSTVFFIDIFSFIRAICAWLGNFLVFGVHGGHGRSLRGSFPHPCLSFSPTQNFAVYRRTIRRFVPSPVLFSFLMFATGPGPSLMFISASIFLFLETRRSPKQENTVSRGKVRGFVWVRRRG